MKTGFEWQGGGHYTAIREDWYANQRKWLYYWGQDRWGEFWDNLLLNSLTDVVEQRLLPGGTVYKKAIEETPFGIKVSFGVNWNTSRPIFSGFVLTPYLPIWKGKSPCWAGTGDYISYPGGIRYKKSLYRYNIHIATALSLSYCCDVLYRNTVKLVSFNKFCNAWGISSNLLGFNLGSSTGLQTTVVFRDMIDANNRIIHYLEEWNTDWNLNLSLNLNLTNAQFMPESLEVASDAFGGLVVGEGRAGSETNHYYGYLVGCNPVLFDFPRPSPKMADRISAMKSYNELDNEVDLPLFEIPDGFRKLELTKNFGINVFDKIPCYAEPLFTTELTALRPYVVYGVPFTFPNTTVPIAGITFVMLALEPLEGW